MSEFYGWLQGNRGETHRCGSKNSGVWAKIQSWYNSCSIDLRRDENTQEDVLSIDFGSKGRKKNMRVYINGKKVIQNGD